MPNVLVLLTDSTLNGRDGNDLSSLHNLHNILEPERTSTSIEPEELSATKSSSPRRRQQQHQAGSASNDERAGTKKQGTYSSSVVGGTNTLSDSAPTIMADGTNAAEEVSSTAAKRKGTAPAPSASSAAAAVCSGSSEGGRSNGTATTGIGSYSVETKGRATGGNNNAEAEGGAASAALAKSLQCSSSSSAGKTGTGIMLPSALQEFEEAVTVEEAVMAKMGPPNSVSKMRSHSAGMLTALSALHDLQAEHQHDDNASISGGEAMGGQHGHDDFVDQGDVDDQDECASISGGEAVRGQHGSGRAHDYVAALSKVAAANAAMHRVNSMPVMTIETTTKASRAAARSSATSSEVVIEGGATATTASSAAARTAVAADPNGHQNPSEYLASVLDTLGYPSDPVPAADASARGDYFLEHTPEQIASYDGEVTAAVRRGDVHKLRTMLEGGRDLQCSNRFGESIVHMACRRGSLEVLQFLVEEAGVSVRVRDDLGRTPLHDACWTTTPAFELVKTIVRIEPDLLLVSDRRGHTPLGYVRRDDWGAWVRFLDENREMLVPRMLVEHK